MSVVAFNGNVGAHTIGLIACSRHQSNYWLPTSQHQPRMDFINPVNGGPSVDYLRRNLGYESSRFSRTYYQFWKSEQWTGHTALFVRMRGQASWARGWVPQPSLTAYGWMIIGSEICGQWRDDLSMIDDPTCLSLEFDVPPLHCIRLMQYWTFVKKNFTNYCFSYKGEGRCNCVRAATTVLLDFARKYGLSEVAAAMEKVKDSAQGKLMNQIAGGELLASAQDNAQSAGYALDE